MFLKNRIIAPFSLFHFFFSKYLHVSVVGSYHLIVILKQELLSIFFSFVALEFM